MRQILAGAGLSLLIITLAWGAGINGSSETEASCLTRHDVSRFADRSRNGVSLTCNEAVRQANELARSDRGRS